MSETEMPYTSWDRHEDPATINMTQVRHRLMLSGERARYLPEQDAWAFPLGYDTQDLHLFGPLYQVHGSAEKFARSGELTDYTSGTAVPTDIGTDPFDVSAWIARTTQAA